MEDENTTTNINIENIQSISNITVKEDISIPVKNRTQVFGTRGEEVIVELSEENASQSQASMSKQQKI